MVIVEHCKFGNLKQFLSRNRQHFIDQINQDRNKIDASLLSLTPKGTDNHDVSVEKM